MDCPNCKTPAKHIETHKGERGQKGVRIYKCPECLLEFTRKGKFYNENYSPIVIRDDFNALVTGCELIGTMENEHDPFDPNVNKKPVVQNMPLEENYKQVIEELREEVYKLKSELRARKKKINSIENTIENIVSDLQLEIKSVSEALKRDMRGVEIRLSRRVNEEAEKPEGFNRTGIVSLETVNALKLKEPQPFFVQDLFQELFDFLGIQLVYNKKLNIFRGVGDGFKRKYPKYDLKVHGSPKVDSNVQKAGYSDLHDTYTTIRSDRIGIRIPKR